MNRNTERFQTTFKCQIKDKKITKYRSTESGLTITHVDVKGPIVKGYFVLATEESSDDGLPHTLEHLIFLGSELYPYKGILDLVANQCFAQGTNAWTAIDHTAYTVETAGSDGFLTLLPIYLDHILFPTLTDAAFTTEVHHINGDGEDAGVVYCEMQARENDAESREEHAVQHSVFLNNCGYKWETGGIMENLRTSCSNEKVRAYHKKFYRPENLDIIICGDISPEKIFDAVIAIDDRASKVQYGPYTKPWSSSVEMFTTSLVKKIEFPAREEDSGRLCMTWKGPHLTEMKRYESHYLFWLYMIKTSASPLVKALVDIPKPYCSSISFSSEEYPVTLISIHFSGTSPESQDEIHSIVMKTLQETITNSLDMDRLTNIIKNQICNFSDKLEDDPSEILTENIIFDFLYGGNDHQLLSLFVALFDVLDEIKQEDEPYWKNIGKFYIQEPCITVISTPSLKCMEELAQNEETRLKSQKEALGATGLLRQQDILERAQEQNETEFDDNIIDDLPKPSLKNISFHSVKTSDESIEGIFCHQIESDFCRFFITFETSKLSLEFKNLLGLYATLFCDTPLIYNGKMLTHEEAIKKKEQLFLKASCKCGGSEIESCSELVTMEFKFMMEDFEDCKYFIRDLMTNKYFTVDRIDTAVKKISSTITTKLRKASVMLNQIDSLIKYNGSCKSALSLISQQKVLELFKSNLPVLAEKLKSLQEELFYDNEIILHVIANENNIAKIDFHEMKKLFGLSKSTYPINLPAHYRRKMDTCKRVLKCVPSDESSYMIVNILSFSDYAHPDSACVALFSEYISQLEGPCWKQIRGQGFAYSYSIFNAPTSSNLIFYLGKATNVTKGFLAGKDVVDSIIKDNMLDSSQVNTAKGSMAFGIIDKFGTPYSTAFANILNLQKGLSLDHDMKRLNEIMNIENKDLLDVGIKYFKDLFDVKKAQIVICCPPNKECELKKDMEDLGLGLTVIDDISTFLAENDMC